MRAASLRPQSYLGQFNLEYSRFFFKSVLNRENVYIKSFFVYVLEDGPGSSIVPIPIIIKNNSRVSVHKLLNTEPVTRYRLHTVTAIHKNKIHLRQLGNHPW